MLYNIDIKLYNQPTNDANVSYNVYAVTIFTANPKNSWLAIFTAKKNKDAALSLRTIYPIQAPCFTPWSR